MEWSPVLIEQTFGLARGDVLSVTVDSNGCSVVCAPNVPAETVAEINAVVKCDAPADMALWRAMRDNLKKGRVASQNWGSLTATQKDAVLHGALDYILYQEEML